MTTKQRRQQAFSVKFVFLYFDTVISSSEFWLNVVLVVIGVDLEEATLFILLKCSAFLKQKVSDTRIDTQTETRTDINTID